MVKNKCLLRRSKVIIPRVLADARLRRDLVPLGDIVLVDEEAAASIEHHISG